MGNPFKKWPEAPGIVIKTYAGDVFERVEARQRTMEALRKVCLSAAHNRDHPFVPVVEAPDLSKGGCVTMKAAIEDMPADQIEPQPKMEAPAE